MSKPTKQKDLHYQVFEEPNMYLLYSILYLLCIANCVYNIFKFYECRYNILKTFYTIK